LTNPYIIRISSQKGGVGKTTIATNLASAIRDLGYKVLLVDFDFTNPSVGFHMGLENVNSGIGSVLKKKAVIKHVAAVHEPTGLHVLPGEVRCAGRLPRAAEINAFLGNVKRTNYDFIFIDTAPGYDPDIILSRFDEDIIVTTPDVPACVSACRLSAKYDKAHLKHSLIVNKVRNARYELSYSEILDMYGGEINGLLYEDEVVPASIAAHIPAYVFRPRARFSRGVGTLSKRYVSRAGTSYLPEGTVVGGGVFAWFRSLFLRR
jgi:MinD-like ATPase involved in chromosome partitioning or flagellar assembly